MRPCRHGPKGFELRCVKAMTAMPQPGGLDYWTAPRRPRPGRAGRVALATAVSVLGHLAILVGVSWRLTPDPREAEPDSVSVALIDLASPDPAPAPAPPAPAKAAPQPKAAPPPQPQPATAKARPAPPVPVPALVSVTAAPAPDPSSALSDSQIASATRAGAGSGSGSGGRACDMVAFLQAELRKDGRVRNAVASAQTGGRPAFVWNGEWIRSPGQEGEGLAVVRQAVMVEVAFAPPPCRTDPVRGLVLIDLDDAPGGARIILGAAQWRWSDLLG